MKRLTQSTLLTLLMAFTMLSCNSSGKKENTDSKTITIGYVDGWAEGIAMTYVTKEIFEANGYIVKTQRAAVDLLYASLSNGDTDAYMDAWLPVTHGSKIKKFEGKIEQLGVNYTNAKIGLVVPKYVTINSIKELNANKDKFEEKIIGIEKGAGLTAKTDKVVEEYGLELKHMTSSSIAMLAELKKAIDKNKWIVVAGWAPHWKFGRYDLKFLEDPKGVYGAAETIETYARKGLKEDDPFAANYFSKFSLTEQQMADLLLQMNSGESKEVAAKSWVAANNELVATWLK